MTLPRKCKLPRRLDAGIEGTHEYNAGSAEEASRVEYFKFIDSALENLKDDLIVNNDVSEMLISS